jgi:uncharacterized protein
MWKLIAIGNGTASRDETDRLATEWLMQQPSRIAPADKLVVSEAGASVYSASELAAREFPEVDVSCAGRCPSPAACKTRWRNWSRSNRKAIGVGQYQHDVGPDPAGADRWMRWLRIA